MLKWIKNIVIVLGTAVLLVLIAYFPKITAILQDKKMLSQVHFGEVQSVQLDIRETLPALGKLALTKNVHKGNLIEVLKEDASMSVEKVQETVYDALESYHAAGLLPVFEEDYSEYRPFLVWGNDNTVLSGIVWECMLVGTQENFNEVHLLIDDETGAVLLIQFWGNDIVEDSLQEVILSTFCQIYFNNLQIVDFQKFVTDDLEHQYIGDNVHGVRYRFGDAVYGEVNVDFFVSKNGFYMEFSDKDVKRFAGRKG